MSSAEAPPDRAWMTPLLNRIADAAGERAAILLASDKAGQQIYIPASVEPGHWLALLVGIDAARRLAAGFGGEKLVIPPAFAGDKRRRAEAIIRMIGEGRSNNQIAAALGVARSTIVLHRQRVKDDRQRSLF